MKSLHPASLILFGFAFLIAASTRSGMLLVMLACAVAASGYLLAARHFVSILRRSRWLLLTMLALFGWMTPGTPVPMLPAATEEGLWLAAENISRLLIAIATVAALLTALAPQSLVSGLRTLLAPLAPIGDFRDRLAVRLMLTLQEVETARLPGSEAAASAERMYLPVVIPGMADHFAFLGSVALILLAVLA